MWWRSGGKAKRRAGVRRAALAVALAILAGCGARTVAPTPGHPQSGVASWYGPGFHGQPTSSGAIYDQHALTAAHQKLPLGTRVRVTNLENGKSVEVLVNDRGPFAKGRIIDLSYAAAREIGMVGPGTARVRVDVAARPANGASHVAYCVQVGAFGEESKARALRARLADDWDDVYISPVDREAARIYRVRVGPYAERAWAETSAAGLAALGLPAVVTEEPQR
ncbi:MAG: septal ring lytic transglycosylase RlpA family protein [Deltaproteobacteria bacterium]|nr:septal ring lytic transglycosylase RlpA family protein [Deltaproteobacteria bacterium]